MNKIMVLKADNLRIITTSTVTNTEIPGDIYVIHTRNSIYYIKVKNS